MGSGHFLVSAVDFLTDYIADLVEFAPAVPDWLPDDDPYHSPLLDRVAAIRADILQRAAQSGWAVNQAQLTDQAIIRRLVLKRCIYGVDKNPLTVELAKVSLWLHSFTVGAPLSFLDHHLRCGDSLIGLRIADAKAELQRLNVPMFVESALQGVENAAHGMRQIEQLSDADVTEVHQSETLFHAVESATAHLRGFLDTLTGLRWHTAGLRVRQRAHFESPLTQTLAANPTRAFSLLAHGAAPSGPPSSSLSRAAEGRGEGLSGTQPPSREAASSSLSLEGEGWGEGGSQPQHPRRANSNPSHESRLLSPLPREEGQREGSSAHPTPPQEAASSSLSLEGEGWGEGGSQPQQPTQGAPDPAFTTLLQKTKSIAKTESFLHWEAAFPGVWRHWQNHTPQGGFDAVIGNPPWDRIKLQEVEWFATRDPDLARAPTAAARRQGIKRLRDQGDPLAAAFDAAKARADQLGKVVRASGHYPLLGGGDINLYSLFVERSLRLVKPNGLVGLLTPSGIYADRTAARFFKSVSTTGRVAGIYDFENRKIFFKDIHASFKFCALIVGGTERTFPETTCAFFLHDTDTITDPDRAFTLSPDDFARVNPNTGTAPVFRTRRDADLTRRIYQRHPVLVDRSGDEERKVWPVRYHTMFHMANDSHLFRTAAQLEDDGFYPVQGNRWKRGEGPVCTALRGQDDSGLRPPRCQRGRVNPENLNRPSSSHEASPSTSTSTRIPASWLPEASVLG